LETGDLRRLTNTQKKKKKENPAKEQNLKLPVKKTQFLS
jgi:hypothetical protein